MNYKKLDPLAIPVLGTNHIEASAGTGKTHNITKIYLRLLLQLGLQVDEILVVTFTEAATAELRQRIRHTLVQSLDCVQTGACEDKQYEQVSKILQGIDDVRQKLTLAIAGFDRAAIFTIHGFCNKMLHENAFESGVLFDTELIKDQQAMLAQVVSDYWSREVTQAHPAFIKYLKQKKHSPSSLLGLVNMVISQPDAVLLPKSVTTKNPEIRYQYAFDQLRTNWQQKSDEIAQILQEAYPGLKAGSYKIEQLQADLKTIDQDMGSGALFFPDEVKWIKKFACDEFKVKKNGKRPEHAFFNGCQKLLELYPPLANKALSFRLGLVNYAREQLAVRKDEMNVQSYDDMLIRLHTALGEHGDSSLADAIREKYKAALIDEFQDTDTIQSEILTHIFSGRGAPVFQIGDPKQSIFRFRGADVFSYIKAEKLASNHYTLDTNWRSDPSLIHAVNALFKRLPDPFLSKDISFHEVKACPSAKDAVTMDSGRPAPLQIRFIPNQGRKTAKPWAQENIPGLVAADIVELLEKKVQIETANDGITEKRQLAPNDIAVIVRTNAQAQAVGDALGELGVPSVRAGDTSVFESQEARDLLAVVAAVANPGDSSRIKTALATGIMGKSAKEIFSLDDEYSQGKERLENWISLFRDWKAAWEESGFAHMFRQLMGYRPDGKSMSTMARIMALTKGQRRITNLFHLSELLQKASQEQHLGIDGILEYLEQKALSGQRAMDEYLLRLESDENAVRLVTIFKAKGLEYPVVFCPYFWDGVLRTSVGNAPCLYHDPDDEYIAKLDIGEDLRGHRKLEEAEIMAENMRLLYVALTRAKHLCVVTWGYFTKSENSPLGYLLFCPEHNENIGATKKHIKSLDDQQALEQLRAIQAQSTDSIEIRQVQLPLVKPSPMKKESKSQIHLERRVAKRNIRRLFRTFSYSGMTSSHKRINPAQEQGLDHDEQQASDNIPTDPPKAPEVKIPTVDMPRGGRIGNMFHCILEEIDFSLKDEEQLQTVTQQKLRSFGFANEGLADLVVQSIKDCLGVHYDPAHPNFRLTDVPSKNTLREMHFWLPADLCGDGLARVFGTNQSPEVPDDYAKSLAGLDIGTVQGFMQGYIDLVYEYKGKWYVVDYKSNFLGEHYSDYHQRLLPRHMAGSHYYLQYHLYTLALHRYLKYRLSDYDYDRHIGGVFYLFLRGMSPDRGAEYGVFSDKPSNIFICDLDQAIGVTKDKVTR